MNFRISRFKFSVFLVLLIAFIVRVWGIDMHPVGFTQDEAGIGYDAYSLLKTGKDQWGVSFPLTLRSFGDFKLPLYSYLAIPSIAVFGLNEFATRLPNALLGFFAVVATYLMVSEMSKNRALSFTSALFLALSPWHIPLSRGAFEANLTVFFMTAGVWTFLKGLKDSNWMLASSILFGLNLFSYHSARMITPIIYILLVVIFYPGKFFVFKPFGFVKEFKTASLLLLIFLSLALGTIFFGGAKRGADILITNPTDNWRGVSDRRYEAVLQGLPDEISRIFNNKVTYSLDLFFSNYLTYVSPNFLFIQGAGEWNYGMLPGRGVLYLFELLTVSTGLILIVKKKTFRGIMFILLWILLSPVPAALTKGPGYSAIRSAVMMPAIQVLSAYGAVWIFSYMNDIVRKRHLRRTLSYMSFIIIIVCFVTFLEDYIYHQPRHGAKAMQVSNKEITSKVIDNESAYDRIIVSRTLSVPHIWIAFYSTWSPSDLQNYSKSWLEYERQGKLYIDQFEGYRLGKYIFGSLDIEAYKQENNILVVGKKEEFPNNVNPFLTTEYPDGTIAFQAVESNILK